MPRTKRVVKAVDVIWTIPDSLWPTLEAILSEFYHGGEDRASAGTCGRY